MAFALVAHVQTAGGVNGGVSSAIDTTGANLIVINVSFRASAGISVTDNKGNTYTSAVTSVVGGAITNVSTLFFCLAPTVGTGHTFTLSNPNSFSIAEITAWSGAAAASVLDVTNNNNGTGSTQQAGAVTPSQGNSLVIAGLSSQVASAASIDGGFTISDQAAIVGGSYYSGATAYLVQTAAALANPTWSSTAVTSGATIAVFKPGAATTAITPGAGSITLTGAAPTVAAGTSIIPAVGAIAMTGFAPGLAAGASITPGAGSVALSGFAPTVSTGAADVTLTPGAGALVLSGYAVTVMASAPTPIVSQTGGFDAGGFGKWFNLANGSSSPRRPKRRDSEIGRALDDLVYGDDDRAALAELADEDADEAREIVAEAARAIAATPVSTGALARALVAPQAQAFRVIVDKSADEAWRLFLTALARQATEQRRTAIAHRIAQDNADLLIVAQFVL